MNNSTEWPFVHRIVHLTSGIRATNVAQKSTINISPALSDKEVVFELDEFKKLYSTIQSKNLHLIGVEFYDHGFSIDGIYPPEWRLYYPWQNEVWPVYTCQRIWGELANAAFQKDDFYFTELARKIQFQIESCCWEVKSLSEAYNKELTSVCRLKNYKDGTSFETQNSLFIYMSAYAFFSNIGTLRDYIAEYAAAFLLKELLPHNIRITKMSSLMSELRKTKNTDNLVIKELLSVTDHQNENAWLAKLSDYRDLVVHYAPISFASHRAFVYQKSQIINDQEVPGIFFPLPRDPYDLRQKRSKGTLHESAKDWIKYSYEFKVNDEDEDTLKYCHYIIGRLAYLALQLAGLGPYRPEPIHITKKDIIGKIQTNTYPS